MTATGLITLLPLEIASATALIVLLLAAFHRCLTTATGLTLAGLFLAFGYTQTRQLWLPIGLHIGWNFFEGTVFGFSVSGMDWPTLILQRPQGPELITGGAFGPEAGLIQLPALIIGGLLIYFYTRRRRLIA